MSEPAYITAVAAIGWIAFQDFDGISRCFDEHDKDLWKWKISHKPTLLACFTAIRDNKPWSAQDWLKESDYTGAELQRSTAEEIIKKSDKPVEQLISDLSRDIENDALATQKVDEAQEKFLEAACAQEIEIMGLEENSAATGILKPISVGYLLCEDIFLDIAHNEFCSVHRPNWTGLKVKRTKVLELWPSHLNSTPIAPPKNKRGAKPKHSWPQYRKKFDDLIQYYGPPGVDQPDLKNQAALEKKLTEWGESEFGSAPSTSMLRRHVSKWLEEVASATIISGS